MSLKARYSAAMHRIQSAIAYALTKGDTMATPKHLRVGLNSALASDKALVDLLIAKGVITRDEYTEAVVTATEEEADRTVEQVRADHNLPSNVDFG